MHESSKMKSFISGFISSFCIFYFETFVVFIYFIETIKSHKQQRIKTIMFQDKKESGTYKSLRTDITLLNVRRIILK
jgi:hypothetical protein